jgi:hypothetical protein
LADLNRHAAILQSALAATQRDAHRLGGSRGYPGGVRRLIADMNPTLRGFLIIALVAGVIVVLQLYQTLVALSILARIAFLLAVAFFVYLAWRERRGEISEWSTRARTAFYGAAILIVVDIGLFTFAGASGLDAVAFVLVLALSACAMWRTWRQEHTYS